jgi:hypothetical protein
MNEEQKEKKRNYLKDYYEVNKEHIKTYSKAYKEINRDILKESNRLYKEKNKEIIKAKYMERFVCDCGKFYTTNHKSTHMKSKHHITWCNEKKGMIVL